MLNYLWSALIIISILFSAGCDINDEINNTYQNTVPVEAGLYKKTGTDLISLYFENIDEPVLVRRVDLGGQSYLEIPVSKKLPERFQLVAQNQSAEDKSLLRAEIKSMDSTRVSFVLPEVHWVKLRAVVAAAFDMAEFAVKLAIGLAGIMVLWLGLMRIAEKSGLMLVFVNLFRPLLSYLFPEIPKNHPVLGSISLNMAANVLGLGNAATPMGIKAMKELQALNQKKDEASNSMCMFLAINTSSVQLLPPVTLIALMGPAVSGLMLPIIMATTVSTVTAIVAVKLFSRGG